MSKIIEIEDALNRINGDNFQEFCNHFLYYKLNPNSIDPIGSVVGKEKSRKGIPDSYFTTKEGELIFAEYTTKEKLGKSNSFFEKLKSDIENCFDQSKTSLKPDEINKVILCFTSRIEPKERKELQGLSNKYNEMCVLELIGIRDLSYAVLDYPLLGDYLGINVSTGQIQNPSDFIADYEKNKLSTPLSNAFWGRKDEIEDGLNKLDVNNVLLIYGAPGTGKSKYAIELSKRYSDAKKDIIFLCIGNKGISIWEDLKKFIRKDKKYILLIDDANRLAKNYQWILSLVNDNDKSLKIVVTVRDYALSLVKNISRDINYSTIEIKELLKDDIEEIIKSSDFNIKEPAEIDRILNISKGNVRLAIMCAKVASESKNILLLNDASQIYDEYFSSIFEEIQILKEAVTLKTLAVISFFGKIDKDNRDFCDNIFIKLGINENRFWEICYSLNENELVDLFEQQIVKISDQIFATYIFYKAVIDLETIKFDFFLDNYLDYENRIRDTIIPVLNIFNYKKIEEKLKPLIISKWSIISSLNNYEKSFKFLDLFWFYLSPQILIFLKKHIDSQKEPDIKNYRYTYESNEFSYGPGTDIEMLSRFKYFEPEKFKDALELLFYYGTRIPDKLPALIYTVKEKFCFTRLGYRYGDHIQHTILDFLIEKAENSKDKMIFEKILLQILPDYLKIEYHENEGDGHQISLYTFCLWLSNSIKSFRKKCFEYLDRKAIDNKTILLQSISNLSVYDYKFSNEIYECDKVFLFSLINKYFNPDEFEDCFVFQEFIEKLEILGLVYPKKLKNKFRNKLFQLAVILKSNRKRRRELSWQDEEKLHENELVSYCKDFQYSDYIKMFENIDIIIKKTLKGNLEWQYYRAIDIIIGDISKKEYKLFIQVIKEVISKFQFRLNYLYIFNAYFRFNSMFYHELFSAIKNDRIEIKLAYHQCFTIKDITPKHLQILYKDLLATISSIENQYFFWNLTFISKYTQKGKESINYIEVLDIILNKIKKVGVKISVDAQFIEKCLTFSDFPFERIIEAYLYTNKFEQHFDYKKELFKKLFERDNQMLFRLLNFQSQDRLSLHDLEHENFDFIWGLDDYLDFIKSLFDYFLENTPSLFWEEAINAFFPKNNGTYGDKPIVFLDDMIANYSHNEKYMELVFNIICYSFPGNREEFLCKFLTLNTDFNTFEKLELVNRGGVYTGSRIPHIENDKLLWQSILSVIEKLPNRLDYIEHKEFVSRQIEFCSMDIKREMKSEFIDDYR